MYALKDTEDQHVTYDEIINNLVEEGYVQDIDPDRFKIEMTHNHMPKMEEKGLIEYDSRTETIVYNADEDVEELVEKIENFETFE